MAKIAVIEAGSASFGENMLSAIMPDPVITNMETTKQILDDYLKYIRNTCRNFGNNNKYNFNNTCNQRRA